MDVIDEVKSTVDGKVGSDGMLGQTAEVAPVEKVVYRGVVAAVLAAVVVLTVRSLPDIKRYLRIKQM